MNVFFWAIDPRVAFWTRFEANFRLGRNQGPLFLNGLASPRVPGQLQNLFLSGVTSGSGTHLSTSTSAQHILFCACSRRQLMDQELKSMLSLLLTKVDNLNDKFDGLNGR